MISNKIFKEDIKAEIDKKYTKLEQQKICIERYKHLKKRFETIDFDKIDNEEQKRLINAYLFCQYCGEYTEFKIHKNQPWHFESNQIKNLIPFDTTKFASTLLGIQNCKQTNIWFDKTFLKVECGTEEYYEPEEFYTVERVRAIAVCPSDFDDKKEYSKKQILNLVKSKKIFLLGFDHFVSKIFRAEIPADLAKYYREFEIKSKKIKTTKQFVLCKAFSRQPETITIPAGTELEESKLDTKSFHSFYDWKKTLAKSKSNTYIDFIQKLYPNFVTEYLKQLKNELPKEILARITQAKQTHEEIKTFVEEILKNYKAILEDKVQKIESCNQKQLDKAKNIQEVSDTNFEF